MIKLFVSDLDGTMLHEGQLFETDISALKELINLGIYLCFASGRVDNEIVTIMEELGGNFHRISMNGTYIYSKEGDELLKASFQPSSLTTIYEAISPEKFLRYAADDKAYYIEEKSELVKEIEKKAQIYTIEEPNLRNQLGKSIVPGKFVVLGEDEDLFTLQEQLQTEMPELVTSFISAKNCLDIVPANVSKGSAISILMDKLNLTPNEIACVGDSYNDIPMFSITPHSFAMMNADDHVKSSASHVVKSVAEAVERVLSYNLNKLG